MLQFTVFATKVKEEEPTLANETGDRQRLGNKSFRRSSNTWILYGVWTQCGERSQHTLEAFFLPQSPKILKHLGFIATPIFRSIALQVVVPCTDAPDSSDLRGLVVFINQRGSAYRSIVDQPP